MASQNSGDKSQETLSAPADIEVRLFINGEFVPSKYGKKIDVVNPATEQLTASVEEAGPADVDVAVEAAKAAFLAWSERSGFDRANFFYALADLYEKHNLDLARLEAVSMGRPIGQYFEGINCARLLRYYAGKATDIQGESSLQTANFLNLTVRQPFGVCAAIIPWNAPVSMFTFKVAPALITGNTIVVKTSEKAPLTGLFLAKLYKEAGFPPGVINVLSGTGLVCGSALAYHLDVRKISFTGSAAAGRAIKKAAAESNLKKVTLEMGGKSPLIIFPDADMDRAIPETANSIIANAGQQCIATSRVYVHSSISKTFMESLVKAMEQQGANPPATNNPLSWSTKRGPQADILQFKSIMGFLDEAKAHNFEILTGGERDGTRGYFIKPTLIHMKAEDEKASLMTREVFGPVQCICTFETEQEAIDRCNDSEYGLYASVFTKDISRALRVAKRFEAGMVGVNCTSPMTTFDMPFGGWKESGDGRELSSHSLDAWTELKTIYIAM